MLTDFQKKKIIADYVEYGSYNKTAKSNGVSRTTVKAIVTAEADILQKCQQKKEQNTLDMLAYMESRCEQAQKAMDECLMMLADPKKLEEATLSQIATAFGILCDKFTKNAGTGTDAVAVMFENIQTLAAIVSNPAPNRNIEDYEEK